MAEIFHYPVGDSVLKTPEEYGALFVPGYHDFRNICSRIQTTITMMEHNTTSQKLTFLDYGCGAGTFLYHVASRWPDWRCEGWESDYSSFQIATRFFQKENTTFQRKPYTAHESLTEPRFDIITFLEVLEHVHNPGQLLAGLRQGLKAGGLLVLSTPNFFGFNAIQNEVKRRIFNLVNYRNKHWYLDYFKRHKYDPATDAGHVTLHSLNTLSLLLGSSGFEVVDFKLVPLSNKPHHRLFPETLIMAARKVDV